MRSGVETERPSGAPALTVPQRIAVALAGPVLSQEWEDALYARDHDPYLADLRAHQLKANADEAARLVWLKSNVGRLQPSTRHPDPEHRRWAQRVSRVLMDEARRELWLIRWRTDSAFRLARLKQPKPPTTLLGLLHHASKPKVGRAASRVATGRLEARPSPARMTGAKAGRRSDTSSPSPPDDDPPDEDSEPSHIGYAHGSNASADAELAFADAVGRRA
jgi:hypothetical protein